MKSCGHDFITTCRKLDVAPQPHTNKQLDEAKNATEATWGSVKAGTKKAYNGLKVNFQQARQWASNKIAP